MVTLFDVPAEEFIEALAARLEDHLEAPDWATHVKSGADRELPPEQADFWHRRAASVFRTVAIDGPVGVDRLTTRYGAGKAGSNRYGVGPIHRTDASGKIIRTMLQQLEAAGFIDKAPGDRGRQITPEGRSFLDETAGDVLEDLDRPDLERYA